MVSESPGRNMRERRSSLETDSLGGRDSYLMSKTVESVAYWLKRQFPPAGYQRWHGGKDTPSNWRSPPRPIEKSTEKGRLYNLKGKSVEGERVADGFERAMKRGNARRAKEPCYM